MFANLEKNASLVACILKMMQKDYLTVDLERTLRELDQECPGSSSIPN
jgi:hypothetical protein